jgi:hypothetical protein
MFYYYAFATNQPFGNRITLTQPAGGLGNPWQGYPGGNPFPLNITSNLNFQPGPDDANHAQEGVFIWHNRGRLPENTIDRVSIYDIAPSILDYFSIAPPPEMIGRIL